MKNIVIIILDCLRHFEALNMDFSSRMPNISRIRENFFTFEQNIASTSVTLPAFLSLLSGAIPIAHGVKNQLFKNFNSKLSLLPDILRANNYKTSAYLTGPFTSIDALNPLFDECRIHKYTERMDSNRGTEILQSLDKLRKQSTPFFSLIHFYELHIDRYINSSGNYRITDYDYLKSMASIDSYIGKILENIDLDKTILVIMGDHGEAVYKTAAERIIGNTELFFLKVFQKLKLASLNRMVKIYKLGHGFDVTEDLIRTPMFLNIPGYSMKKKFSNTVRSIDLYFTLLELLKIKNNYNEFEFKDFDLVFGKSLIPIINGNETVHRIAYVEAPGPTVWSKDEERICCIREFPFKYTISPFNPSKSQKLFNLELDPYEKKDFSDKFPDKFNELKEKYNCLMENIEVFHKKNNDFIRNQNYTNQELQKIQEQLKELGYM